MRFLAWVLRACNLSRIMREPHYARGGRALRLPGDKECLSLLIAYEPAGAIALPVILFGRSLATDATATRALPWAQRFLGACDLAGCQIVFTVQVDADAGTVKIVGQFHVPCSFGGVP